MLQLFKPFHRVKMYITQSDHLYVQSMQHNGTPGCILPCFLKSNTEYTIYFKGITNSRVCLCLQYSSDNQLHYLHDYCFVRGNKKEHTFKNNKDCNAYLFFVFIEPPHLKQLFILMDFKITTNVIVEPISKNIELNMVEEPNTSVLVKDNTKKDTPDKQSSDNNTVIHDKLKRDSNQEKGCLEITDLKPEIDDIKISDSEENNILYVVSNPVIENSVGYAIRTNYICNYIKSCLVVLNPFLDKNVSMVQSNTITAKNQIQYMYYDIEHLIQYIQDNKITKIIVCSDGNNFMSIYNGLKNIPNFNLIHWTYEVRGLWYLSAEANYKYKKIYSLKKSYLDHLQSIEKQALESCNQYICITDEVAEYIKRTFGIYNKPHCMIYNAICMKTIKPIQKKLRSNVFVIGVFGSIVPYEGIHLLVKACIELFKTHKQLRLLIVGNNKMGLYLKHPCITYIPWVSTTQLQQYYSAIDLYCIPRLNYTVCHLISPLKPFEPFYHKIPVLVSNCQCLVSISGNGTRCRLFERENIHSLKQNIISVMLYGYHPQLLENAYQFVSNDRNWENQCKRYINFLNST